MRNFIGIFLLVFMSCTSTKTFTKEEISNFKNKIDTQKLELNADFARPLALNTGVTGLQNLLPPGSSIANISLVGNVNFIKINKDSLVVELPYYGRQQLPRNYDATDIGVTYSGVAKPKDKKFNPKNNKYVVKYDVNAENENYQIILTFFPNQKTLIAINSSHRTSINYDGTWKVLEENNGKK